MKSRFTVNQSIPDEYKHLYLRILLIFSEVGLDVLNDCQAMNKLGNKNVVDCYLMFNTAISAYHTGDEKACKLLMHYIDKQLDLIYKDKEFDIDIDDDDNELIEPTFETDDSVIVHKAIPMNPNVGKKYVFCGCILLRDRLSSISDNSVDITIVTTYLPFNDTYRIFKRYGQVPSDIDYLFDNVNYKYSIDNHINALYVVTITKESIIDNNKTDRLIFNNDRNKYSIYSNFDITKAKIEIYCKSNKLYYTSDSRKLLTPPSNVIVYENETFSSNTHREDYIIRDNKVLYTGGMKKFIAPNYDFGNIACARYRHKKWKLNLTNLFKKIDYINIPILTHPLIPFTRVYRSHDEKVYEYKEEQIGTYSSAIISNYYKKHSCRLYPIDLRTNAISIKRFVYNPAKPSLIKYTGIEYDRPIKYKVIKTKAFGKRAFNKDYVDNLRYTICKG